jgi:hypothetical protein
MEHYQDGAAVAFDQLRKFGGVRPPVIELPDPDRLEELIAQKAGLHLTPAIFRSVVLSLTARHPYDSALGRIDMYRPGRWDTEWNLVFMEHVITGPLPGQWDGSAGYVKFAPPSSGKYLVVGLFSGYDTTMTLDGPWGKVSDHTAVTSDYGVVSTVWSASGGTSLYFNFACTNPANSYGMGYLSAIQFFHA